jgi:hypothetical protein
MKKWIALGCLALALTACSSQKEDGSGSLFESLFGGHQEDSLESSEASLDSESLDRAPQSAQPKSLPEL